MLMVGHSGTVQTFLSLRVMQEITGKVFTLLQRGENSCCCSKENKKNAKEEQLKAKMLFRSACFSKETQTKVQQPSLCHFKKLFLL